MREAQAPTPRRFHPRGPEVVVERVDEPIDLDAWVRLYVRTALEQQGIVPAVDRPPLSSVG